MKIRKQSVSRLSDPALLMSDRVEFNVYRQLFVDYPDIMTILFQYLLPPSNSIYGNLYVELVDSETIE